MTFEFEYFRVPLRDFVEGSLSLIDIFLETSPEKVQKIVTKGSHFSTKHIPSNFKKNLKWVLLKKEDYRTYVNFNVSYKAQDLTSVLEISQKLQSLNQNIKFLLSQFIQAGLISEYLENVLITTSNVLYFTVENPATFKLLEKIETFENHSSHSLIIAIWAQLLTRHLGWSSEQTAFHITFCALFHDVGFNQNVDHLLRKPFDQLTDKEVRILESHVTRGRDILKSIPGMPTEASIVAYQHHERVNGKGFPEKLFLNDIHPFSRLIGLINRFYEYHTHPSETQGTLAATLSAFRKDKLHYDLHFFKALEEILEHKAKQ